MVVLTVREAPPETPEQRRRREWATAAADRARHVRRERLREVRARERAFGTALDRFERLPRLTGLQMNADIAIRTAFLRSPTPREVEEPHPMRDPRRQADNPGALADALG